LYHLLTNRAPVDARERFLNPESLVQPRELNSNLSPRIEKAIIWAMSLHPNDRPADVETFRQALLGNWTPPQKNVINTQAPGLKDMISSPTERTLLIVTVGFVILSLLFTLGR
jgi:serine/threonine-protein kinase